MLSGLRVLRVSDNFQPSKSLKTAKSDAFGAENLPKINLIGIDRNNESEGRMMATMYSNKLSTNSIKASAPI